MDNLDSALYPAQTLRRRSGARAYQKVQSAHVEHEWESFATTRMLWYMLLFNVLGVAAHGVGVALTLLESRHSFRLQIMRLQPVNSGTIDIPEIGHVAVAEGYIYMTWVILAFYILSLSFHLLISVVLVAQLSCGRHWLVDWYMRGLYDCCAIWRWAEYFLSASIMLIVTCMLLGIREIHSIWCVVGLMGITITFGWITELHSSNLIESRAPPYTFCGYTLTRRWLPGSWKTRLQIHLLGYLPYGLLWAVVFDQFRMNMEVVGDVVPGFVNTATIGSFCLFTLFGLVQLANQLFPYGPSVYWMGEATYVILSFAAKANLGFIVVYQALREGSPYDAALDVVLNAP